MDINADLLNGAGRVWTGRKSEALESFLRQLSYFAIEGYKVDDWNILLKPTAYEGIF